MNGSNQGWKRWRRWGAYAASAAVLVIALWRFAGDSKQEAPAYDTEPASVGDLSETVSANGTLNPVQLVSVGTQVSGTVRRLHTDYNQRVRAGQILLELDDRTYAAAVRQSSANLRGAIAQLELANANLARGEALMKQGLIAVQDLAQLRQLAASAAAQRDVVQAQLDRDRANLGFTVIRSPVSGVVVSREVDVGQTVAASFQTPTLFTIAQDLAQMQINGSFAEADIGRLKPGLPARFTVDAYPERTFEGTVREVRLQPKTVQNVVTYDVVITVANPDLKLLPGMTAYVSVILAERRRVLRVPTSAFRFRPPKQAEDAPAAAGQRGQGGQGGKGDRARAPDDAGGTRPLYVLRGGALERLQVRTGATDKRFVEVLPGPLQAGDAVVTGGGDGARTARPRVRMF